MDENHYSRLYLDRELNTRITGDVVGVVDSLPEPSVLLEGVIVLNEADRKFYKCVAGAINYEWVVVDQECDVELAHHAKSADSADYADRAGMAQVAIKDRNWRDIDTTYAAKEDVYTKEEVDSLVGSAGGGPSVTVDSALSSTSINPVQNRVITSALANKLDATATAAKATADANGNNIASTYATKAELSGKQDKLVAGANIIINGNTISATGGSGGEGTSITIDSTLSDTSTNPVQNQVITNMMSNLGIIDTDVVPNTIQYTKLKEFSGGYVAAPNSVTLVSSVDTSVKDNTLTVAVNGVESSVALPVSSGDGSVTVDSSFSDTSTNPVQNQTLTDMLTRLGISNSNQIQNIIQYLQLTKVNEKYVAAPKTVTIVDSVETSVEDNTLKVAVNGVESTVELPNSSNVTVDSALSATSTNPVQNKVINTALGTKQDKLVAGTNITISGNTISAAGGSGTSVTVDTTMDPNSENPVQNKVIGAWLENIGIIGLSPTDTNTLMYAKTATLLDKYVAKPIGITLVSSVETSIVDNSLKVAVNGVESSVPVDTTPTEGSTNLITSGAVYSAVGGEWIAATSEPSYDTLFTYSNHYITTKVEIMFVINVGDHHATLHIPKGVTSYYNGDNTIFSTCIGIKGAVSTYPLQSIAWVSIGYKDYFVAYLDSTQSRVVLDFKSTSGLAGTNYQVLYR